MKNNFFNESAFNNLALVEEQFDKFIKDPSSVELSWKTLFENWQQEKNPFSALKIADLKNSQTNLDWRLIYLIEAYRHNGYLAAKFNPLNPLPKDKLAQLQMENYGLEEEDLTKNFVTHGLLTEKVAPLSQIISTLKKIYCSQLGIEYGETAHRERTQWLQQQIESPTAKPAFLPEQQQFVLKQLMQAELFEQFLHTKYVGQKRFSLEGLETLIPLLSQLIDKGAKEGLEEVVLGMAHRGRLNVLAHILQKPYSEIFKEFEELPLTQTQPKSGDVKYHKGFCATILTSAKQLVKLDLSPNPSHLEAVNPVVEGMTKAKQLISQDVEQKHIIPILIHGDASIAGQGVVYETLQLHQLEGYNTGGTIHLILNNQIGFTASPEETRSTDYCTDISKTFGFPIFHVNAEDPEACLRIASLAMELRQKFHCDVFIDLNGYRKYGHNETDEPAFTQPIDYQGIKIKQKISQLYKDQLIKEKIIEAGSTEEVEQTIKLALSQALKEAAGLPEKLSIQSLNNQNALFNPVETAVPLDSLRQLTTSFTTIPQDFNLHAKLIALAKERLKMVEQEKSQLVDWSMAETLAYASLLVEGVDVRLTGQDCRRGTFSHRHAVWVDQIQQYTYFPLQHLTKQQGSFTIYNSPVSEFAPLGFEFGFSEAHPQALVIWEAQFGDFCNGGQVIIDQFIAPSDQKWSMQSRLVLYLPHGYEGQGPEHSSARIERFLALAGDENLWIVNPTTPAQFFHVLRRQMKSALIKPLIIFTPKGLLRHPSCVSALQNLTTGSFAEILEDTGVKEQITRLAFCSGRLYYDLIAERDKTLTTDLAIIRIEQLYPLHTQRLKEIVQSYSQIETYFWVQEEPANMGAWEFMQTAFKEILPKNFELIYRGRHSSASTAVGSMHLHKKETATILQTLFNSP